MKNCYPLAKKILRREYYDVICLGKKTVGYRQLYLSFEHPYDGQGNHIFTSGMGQADTVHRSKKVAPVSHLHLPCRKMNFAKNFTGHSAVWHRGIAIFLLPSGEKGRILYRDIKYIRKSGSSVVIDTMKKSYRIPATMTDMEQELTGIQERFIRVHRDYLVNSRYLSWFWNQEAGLMDGTRIPVSRIYKERVERVVGEKRKKIV